MPAFCARLTSDKVISCTAVANGPQMAVEGAEARFPPAEPPSAAPVVVLWAEPNLPFVDLANNKNGSMVEYKKLVDIAMAYAKAKDAASYQASRREQNDVLARIMASARGRPPQRP